MMPPLTPTPLDPIALLTTADARCKADRYRIVHWRAIAREILQRSMRYLRYADNKQKLSAFRRGQSSVQIWDAGESTVKLLFNLRHRWRQQNYRTKHKKEINAKRKEVYAAKKAAGLLERTWKQKVGERAYDTELTLHGETVTSKKRKDAAKRYYYDPKNHERIKERERLRKQGYLVGPLPAADPIPKWRKVPLTPEEIQYNAEKQAAWNAKVQVERAEYKRRNTPLAQKQIRARSKAIRAELLATERAGAAGTAGPVVEPAAAANPASPAEEGLK
jgi:HD superfamily phosphohydrolase